MEDALERFPNSSEVLLFFAEVNGVAKMLNALTALAWNFPCSTPPHSVFDVKMCLLTPSTCRELNSPAVLLAQVLRTPPPL